MVDDIVGRNQTEEALQDANQFNIEIVSQAGEGIIVYDRDLRYVAWNRFMERMTGVLAEDVLGRNAFELFPHLLEQGVDKLLTRALNGETVTSPDIQFYSNFTNQKGWVVGTYAPHRNARGEIVGVIATLQDITERRRSEETLRDSENRFATIIDFLPDATFVIDLDGKVVAWNRAMEEMTGVSKDDMIGQCDHAYTVPFYGERRQQLLDLLDINDEEIASKYQYVQRKGDTLYAETFASALYGGKGAYVWAMGRPIFDVYGNRTGAIESIRDITERKRAEESLREAQQTAENSKAKYKQVVSMISDIVWSYDVNVQGEHIGSYISPVADRMLGLPDGTIGNSIEKYFSYVHPDDLHSVREMLSEGIRTLAKDLTMEYRLQKADGTTIWVWSKGSAYSQSDGRVTAFGTTSDITERKRAEEELKRTQSSIRIAMDLVKLVRWEYDVESDMFTFDDQFYALYGTTPEREGGPLMSSQDYARKFIPAEDASMVAKEISKALATTDPNFTSQVEHRIIRADGTERIIAVRFGITKDSEGRTIRTYGANQDITERKREQAELQNNVRFLETMINTIPSPIFFKDIQGQYMGCNDTFARQIVGLPKESIIGKSVYELPEMIPSDLADRYHEQDQELFREPGVQVYETQALCADGVRRDFLFSKSTFNNFAGEVAGIVGVMLNITERKKAEEELRQNRNHLEERVRERTSEMERFIYTISHDLRSPLVTVSGFLGLLKEDLESGDSQCAVNDLITISEAITKMDCLLLDTLELSRIGRVANPPEEVPFGQIVQEALRQTEERIKSLDVAVYVAGDMPKVLVDVPRIEEVLVNLIENSVKYMGDQVSPKIDIGSRNDGEETVFFVKDNGMGIDGEEHEKVFGLFYKVDRKSEGTGVGLAIVKRIIEVHGGKIWIESELGEGCMVCFTLPISI